MPGTPGPEGPWSRRGLVTEAPAPEDVCPDGGTAWRFGVDADEDGVLAPEEVLSQWEECR